MVERRAARTSVADEVDGGSELCLCSLYTPLLDELDAGTDQSIGRADLRAVAAAADATTAAATAADAVAGATTAARSRPSATLRFGLRGA